MRRDGKQDARPYSKRNYKHMKLEAKWNLGNFGVRISKDVTETELEELAQVGLLHNAQRAKGIDEALGIISKVNGKNVRSKLTRIDIPYSPAIAEKLKAVLDVIGEAELVEYQREAASLKYRDAKEIAGRHESKGDLEEWLLDKVGFAGDTHGEDGEFSQEMLAAVHGFAKAALAGI
jgi:hypothetical protein